MIATTYGSQNADEGGVNVGVIERLRVYYIRIIIPRFSKAKLAKVLMRLYDAPDDANQCGINEVNVISGLCLSNMCY